MDGADNCVTCVSMIESNRAWRRNRKIYTLPINPLRFVFFLSLYSLSLVLRLFLLCGVPEQPAAVILDRQSSLARNDQNTDFFSLFLSRTSLLVFFCTFILLKTDKSRPSTICMWPAELGGGANGNQCDS